MGATVKYALPYPELAEAANVPQDMQELATAVDTALGMIEAGGANVASAATIHVTAPYHGLTGVTTVDNIIDDRGAVAGRVVRLRVTAGPVKFRDTGGGAGNLRTRTRLDRIFGTDEIVEFIYDGAVWRDVTPLRIVRGHVSAAGGVVAGSGFTASKSATGVYLVTFTVAFPAPPIVALTNAYGGAAATVYLLTNGVNAGSFNYQVFNNALASVDEPVYFMATEV